MSYTHVPNFKNTSRKSGIFSLPIKIVLSIAVILTLIYIFIPNFLPSFFTTIVSPLWRIQAGNVGALPQAINLEKDALLKENEELKGMLGRVANLHPVLAVILKKPPFSAYDILVLDIGNDQKIIKGDKIYVPVENAGSILGNIPIGEIVEVNGNTSKARLYSSAGEKFDVLIGESHIEATATGKGGGTFEVSMPRDTKIAKGNSVFLPSLSDGAMGIVEDIVSEPSEPFSTVLFRQPVNIYELKWIIIQK